MILGDNLFEKFGKVFKPGEIIFCEYEIGNTFYFILNGIVRITKIVGDTEKTLDTMGSGDIFGEMAILEQQPRSATVIAQTEVKALEFNRENFEMLLQSNLQMALKLLKIFCKRIYDAKRQLMIITLDESDYRVADAFLLVAEKKGVHTDERVSVELKVPLDELANMCAISMDETKKALTNFVRFNKIELIGESIKINNISEFLRMVTNKRKVAKHQARI
ncbi:MAG: Crp/Fnr family transcriptional regulator [bacterium]|nr:Crp/Fnr family transcriptional regulator [bacterium]